MKLKALFLFFAVSALTLFTACDNNSEGSSSKCGGCASSSNCSASMSDTDTSLNCASTSTHSERASSHMGCGAMESESPAANTGCGSTSHTGCGSSMNATNESSQLHHTDTEESDTAQNSHTGTSRANTRHQTNQQM